MEIGQITYNTPTRLICMQLLNLSLKNHFNIKISLLVTHYLQQFGNSGNDIGDIV